MPVFGMGTWLMGEDHSRRKQELAALRLGLELGLPLIDTAEMYGDGAAEELVAEAIANQRSNAFLVSKVYPHNASTKGVKAACERSLKRLKTDYLDLYLLHWPGIIPLSETLEAFVALQSAGMIRDFGLSNFDKEEISDAISLEYGEGIAADQVLYNLAQRGIEWDLLSYCRDKEIAVMAYSPIEHSGSDQSSILDNPGLVAVSQHLGKTPAQVALAWLLHQNVSVIPKAGSPAHVRENFEALEIKLPAHALKALDNAFPKPDQKIHLAIR